MFQIINFILTISQFLLIVLSPKILQFLFKIKSLEGFFLGIYCFALSLIIYSLIFLIYVVFFYEGKININDLDFTPIFQNISNSNKSLIFALIMTIFFYLIMFFNLFFFIKKLVNKTNNIFSIFMFLSGYFILYAFAYIGLFILTIKSVTIFENLFLLLFINLLLYLHQFGIIGTGILLYLSQKIKKKAIKVINICIFFGPLFFIILGFISDFSILSFIFIALFDLVSLIIGIVYCGKYYNDQEAENKLEEIIETHPQ